MSINQPEKIVLGSHSLIKQQLAHHMRYEMTPAEAALWQQLRANKQGAHFRRQQVIAGFIVDFYCHATHLVVEADGDVHTDQAEHDTQRDGILAHLGLHVLRFTNTDICCQMETVLQKIGAALSMPDEIIEGQ